MSYARFNKNSSVYVFANSNDFYECQHTSLVPSKLGGESCWVRTSAELVAHLLAHRDAGDAVPQEAIDSLGALVAGP